MCSVSPPCVERETRLDCWHTHTETHTMSGLAAVIMGSSVRSLGADKSSDGERERETERECVCACVRVCVCVLTLIMGKGAERSSGTVPSLLYIVALGRLVDLSAHTHTHTHTEYNIQCTRTCIYTVHAHVQYMHIHDCTCMYTCTHTHSRNHHNRLQTELATSGIQH